MYNTFRFKSTEILTKSFENYKIYKYFLKYVSMYIIPTLNEKLLTKLVGVHISSVLNELLFNNCFFIYFIYKLHY